MALKVPALLRLIFIFCYWGDVSRWNPSSWQEPIQLIEAYWRHMATYIWVNIGSGKGLLPDGTKPLPEAMLTYHQWSFRAFIWQQFTGSTIHEMSSKMIIFKLQPHLPGANELNYIANIITAADFTTELGHCHDIALCFPEYSTTILFWSKQARNQTI